MRSLLFDVRPFAYTASRSERIEHLVKRHIIPAHLPEIAGANNATKDQAARPYVDFALVGDFAGSKDEWLQIQAGNVVNARPTCSWRCPDGWVELAHGTTLSLEVAPAEVTQLAEPASQASPTAALSIGSGAFTPGTSASPTVLGLDDVRADVDAHMKSLFDNDFGDFTSPFSGTMFALVQPSLPATSRSGTQLCGVTGKLYDGDTNRYLTYREQFGIPEPPERPEMTLDEFFWQDLPFPARDEATSMDGTAGDLHIDEIYSPLRQEYYHPHTCRCRARPSPRSPALVLVHG